MKHIETPDKMHLASILNELEKGSFIIPDFQREFEWQPWDILELIKSIFMDYYIGTLLLWKAGDENIHALSCEPVYGYQGEGRPQHIVLDGQQRLTALYYSIFSPDAPYPNRANKIHFFVSIDKLLEESYDEAFDYQRETRYIKQLLKSPETQWEKKILPLSLLKDSWSIMEWVKGYETYWKAKGSENAEIEAEHMKKILKELLNDYYISFIELDRKIPVSKVCEIFTKINSKGVPLSIFDLLNAMLRPHDIRLKEEWRNIANDLSYTDPDKMKIYVLQVMSILKQAYCSPRYLYYLVPQSQKQTRNPDGSKDQTVLIGNSDEFHIKWTEAVEAVKKTITTLKNPRDFGAILPKFVPYPSIIPAFSAIKRYVEISALPDKASVNDKIKKWYWASVFTKNYSSSVESQAARDFIKLKKWFIDEEAIPDAVIQFEIDYKNLDLKSEKKQGSAIYNAIFNILVIRGACDWESFALPEYSDLDDHHIVPASWGKNVVGDDINTILNKTPLSPKTNRHVINCKMPHIYLREMIAASSESRVFELMESHLISKKAVSILLREDFSKEDYYEFIEERKRTIIDAIEQFIIGKKQKEVDYLAIIQKGENNRVEFKSSLRWNYKANMLDTSLEEVVAKAVCAFMNTNGGLLFIGVEDNHNIIGLEKDYKTLGNKQSSDEYQLKVIEVINRFIGKEYYHAITLSMLSFEGKDVCLLDVQKSSTPVFLKSKNGEIFYTRPASKSDPMTSSQATEYIKNHFS